MDICKETVERAESVISDILISDSCVENIIACINSYEITSMENKLQSLLELDPHQESLVMDHDKEPVPHSSRSPENSLNLSQDVTQPPSEPDAHQEIEPFHTDADKSDSAVNSLSQDKTQPPPELDQHHDTEPLDMDQSKEPVLPSSRFSVNSLNLNQDKTQPSSELDQHHETESPDMDQSKEPVLLSSRCSVNSLNLSQDMMITPSQPNTQQEAELLDMDQSKEPVLPSSRCSANFPNFSQGSTQSTLPPPASQQSSSSMLLSLRNNTYGKDIQAYGKSVTKQPKRQRRSNTMSETSKMKQIKEIHKHFHQSLKNSSVPITESEKNILANAKQMLFSIKQQHTVLCESLKADCMRKAPSNKCRESLKKRIGHLQNRQHKLLLLFQEHNVITKKIKMFDSNWHKEAEIATKGQSMRSRKNLRSVFQDKTFPKNFELESESASTIYSFNCSQKRKPKIKKTEERDSSVLHKNQQPVSESVIRSNYKINLSCEQPMSESVIRSNNKLNLSCQQPMSESVIKSNSKMNLSCQQPMSESVIISDTKIKQSRQQPTSELAIISGNKTNLSTQQPMSESALISKTKFPNGSKQNTSYSFDIANQILKLDNKSSPSPSWQNKNIASDDDSASSLANFTVTPIGTVADFTKNIQSQHDFSDDRLVPNSAVTSHQQIPSAINQHPQDVLVSCLEGDIFHTSTNSQSVSVNAVKSFGKYEKTKVDKLQESTGEKTKCFTDKTSFNKNYCEISALTRINLIEDEELVPLDRILPSCQNMDIFANIGFPKFLWEDFHKWP